MFEDNIWVYGFYILFFICILIVIIYSIFKTVIDSYFSDVSHSLGQVVQSRQFSYAPIPHPFGTPVLPVSPSSQDQYPPIGSNAFPYSIQISPIMSSPSTQVSPSSQFSYGPIPHPMGTPMPKSYILHPSM